MKRLTYEQYLSIKNALESGVKPSVVVELSGTSVGTVNRIQNGRHRYDLKKPTPKIEETPTVAEKPAPTVDLTEITRKLDSLNEAIKGDRLYRETQDKKLEMLFGKILAALDAVNTNLKTIHTMESRNNVQLQGIREDTIGISKELGSYTDDAVYNE